MVISRLGHVTWREPNAMDWIFGGSVGVLGYELG
jgi:hypothetical protein